MKKPAAGENFQDFQLFVAKFDLLFISVQTVKEQHISKDK